MSSVKRRYFKEFPNKATYFKDSLPKESFEGFFTGTLILKVVQKKALESFFFIETWILKEFQKNRIPFTYSIRKRF